MLNNKKATVMAIAALLVFTAGTAVQAAEWGYSSLPQNGQYVTKSIIHPLAPQSITQSTDPNTLGAGSIACGNGAATTENSWYRLFDLDGGHGLTGAFCAESVDYGIETAIDNGVPQNLVVTTACLPDGMPYLNLFLNEVGSEVHAQADADLEFFNVTASGCCDADTESMSVELEAPLDCTVAGCGQLYIGSNNLGQSGPTYLASVSCGVNDPTNIADIGFPDMHLVMIVNGDGTDGNGDGGQDGDDGPVPASNGIGMVLMLVLLLGSSAYFMRRRVMN
jgi:hypothetical protein